MDTQSQPDLVLPVELICKIVGFLTPRDVVRLRIVSKQFRDITYEPSVWRSVYANAQLPRPPGPYPSQSTEFLERTLTQSAQVERTWTSEPFHKIQTTVLKVGRLPTGPPKAIGGRWFISCESRQFVLNDTDTDPTTDDPQAQILLEYELPVYSWDARSLISPRGLLLYVLFSHSGGVSPWKLVEFRLNSDTGHVYEYTIMDVPTKHSKDRVDLLCHQAPFLYIRAQRLIFATETRTFYDFPELSSRLTSHPFSSTYHPVLIMNTHILALFRSHDTTIIQAFTIPTDPTPTGRGTSLLQLTHEETLDVDAATVGNLFVIKQSLVDPTTGDTHLRFLRLRHDGIGIRAPLQFFAVDITLPQASASTNTVLPMSIHTHHLFTVDGGTREPITPAYDTYLEYSPDGHVRGFSLRHPIKRAANRPFNIRIISDFSIIKFTINASQEECTTVFGKLSLPISSDAFEIPRASWIGFDGVRGRLYYCVNPERAQHDHQLKVAVVDIK